MSEAVAQAPSAEPSDNDKTELLASLSAKVEAERLKSKARAERFGIEYEEPKLEFILSTEEFRIYMAPGAPGNPDGTQEIPETTAMEVEREIRDRQYVEKIFEKVAEETRKAHARAERFNIPYTAPKLDKILTKPEFRKYMSATAGRNPLEPSSVPIPAIDTTGEEERQRQAERAARFRAMQEAAGITVAEEAQGDKVNDEDEIKRLEMRASKFGVPLDYSPYGEDLGAKLMVPRRELEENPDYLNDTLHCYGVDRLTTAEIMQYFADYSPSYVLWLDDSSGNVVFNDANNARRALYNLCVQIRLPPKDTPAPESTDGSAPQEAAASEARPNYDPVWRRGPNYTKVGITYPVLVRFATTMDRKTGQSQPSKRLWLKGSKSKQQQQQQQRKGGGGASRRGDAGGYASQQQELPQDPPAVPVGMDLRDSIGKARSSRKGKEARKRAHPYAMQIDDQGAHDDDSGEVAMMDMEQADMIIEHHAKQQQNLVYLTEEDNRLLELAMANVSEDMPE